MFNVGKGYTYVCGGFICEVLEKGVIVKVLSEKPKNFFFTQNSVTVRLSTHMLNRHCLITFHTHFINGDAPIQSSLEC